ncbi:MAG: oxygenase MpaB family protein [Dehalococcoidia bacterium]
MVVTPRPAVVPVGSTPAQEPTDDGLFGPESITWRIGVSAPMAIGGLTAAIVQMLVPRVMWMIDQSSSFFDYPESRGERTGQYEFTIIYGDRAAAEHAGETLRAIHRRRSAVDPTNGETYRADQPDLLLWVHNSLTFMLLRAYNRWGGILTTDEQNRFVAEQRVAARLVGLDPEQAAGTTAELQTYMRSMHPKLAFTAPCKRMLDLLAPSRPKPGAPGFLAWVLGRAAIDLFPPEHRLLYGIRWTRLDRLGADAGARTLSQLVRRQLPYSDAVLQARESAIAHAFGRGGKARAPAPMAAS